ncbi:MAG TPA: hypothetical protein VH518_17995, partial [Tepidisphaeraceae bacterium]
PMDDATQRKVMQERYDAEIFKRPLPKSTTQPTTAASAAPTTQQSDVQLQRAVDTMVALLVLQGDRSGDEHMTLPPQMAPKPTTTVAAPAPAPAPVPETPVTAPAAATEPAR